MLMAAKHSYGRLTTPVKTGGSHKEPRNWKGVFLAPSATFWADEKRHRRLFERNTQTLSREAECGEIWE